MSKDWKLNPDTWDFDFNESTNFDLVLIEGIDYYVQKVRIKLQTFLGEWYLNTEVGVDWYGVVLVKSPNFVNIDNLLKLTVLEVEGVNEILVWENTFTAGLRKLNISFRADTDAGEMNFNQEITI